MMTRLSKIMWLFRALVFSLSVILLSGADTISIAGDNKPQKHKKRTVPKKRTVSKKKPVYNSTAPKPVFDDRPINPKKPKKSSSYQKPKQKKKTYNKPIYKKKKVIYKNNTAKKRTYPPKRKPVKKPVKKKIK